MGRWVGGWEERGEWRGWVGLWRLIRDQQLGESSTRFIIIGFVKINRDLWRFTSLWRFIKIMETFKDFYRFLKIYKNFSNRIQLYFGDIRLAS